MTKRDYFSKLVALYVAWRVMGREMAFERWHGISNMRVFGSQEILREPTKAGIGVGRLASLVSLWHITCAHTLSIHLPGVST